MNPTPPPIPFAGIPVYKSESYKCPFLPPPSADTTVAESTLQMLPSLWQIELFGGLTARQGSTLIDRFRTQKSAALFGYLSLYLGKQHSREKLIDLFWPDSDIDAGRISLRVAINSLRNQLEPPGWERGSVLIAEGENISLNPLSISTDIGEIDKHLTALKSNLSANPVSNEDRLTHLQAIANLYAGPLLPGVYYDWAIGEQERWANVHRQVTMELVNLLSAVGDIGQSIDYALRGLQEDPMSRDLNSALIHLYATSGQANAALDHYAWYERRLQEDYEESPPANLAAFASSLSSSRSSKSFRSVIAKSRPTKPAEPSIDRPVIERHRISRLPIQFTPFFGREGELETLQGYLADATDGAVGNGKQTRRLICITGPGGMGKTRIAIEVGRQIEKDENLDVYFIPLASTEKAELIPKVVAASIRLQVTPSQDVTDCLIELLNQRPTLLVLDNFEQIAEEGAEFVNLLLQRVPQLICLVTTRLRLNLEGEREFPLQPLPTPSMPVAVNRLTEFAGAQLFMDRAQSVRPDFQVTPRNVDAIASLCDKLEGVPLAIELAASWIQTLSPAQMLSRLSRRFDLLVSRRRDPSPRHATLWAAIDWSYRLLSPELQETFRAVSVFRGGFTLKAAEKICGISGEETLARLSLLVERSMLVTRESSLGSEDGMRFHQLESIREFGLMMLDAEERVALLTSLSEYFVYFCKEASNHFQGPLHELYMRQTTDEQENLRVVFEFCLQEQLEHSLWSEMGINTAGSIWRFWYHNGLAQEGIGWLQIALQRNQVEVSDVRGRALTGLGALLWHSALYDECLVCLDEALSMYSVLRDDLGIGLALNLKSLVAFSRRDFRVALELGELAFEHRKRTGDGSAVSNSLLNLGIIVRETGDLVAAKHYGEQAMQIQTSMGDDLGLGRALLNLADVSMAMGNHVDSRKRFEEAAALGRRTAIKEILANALKGIAELNQELGLFDLDEDNLAQSAAIFVDILDQFGLAVTLRNQAEADLIHGELVSAWDRAQESLHICRGLRNSLEEAHLLHLVGRIAIARKDISAHGYLIDGLKLAIGLNEFKVVGLIVDQFAHQAFRKGDRTNALRLGSVSEQFFKAHCLRRPELQRIAYENLMSDLRKELHPNDYESISSSGKQLTVMEVIDIVKSM